MSYSIRIAGIAAVVIAIAPLSAQTTPPVRTGRGATTPPATQQAPTFAVDFQDQPVRVIIAALAEAGKLNVTYSNLGNKTASLRLQQPLTTREQYVAVIKGIAEDNDLIFNEAGGVLRVVGKPAPFVPNAQQVQQAAQAAQQAAIAEANRQSLHTFQLKHSSAANIVPVLTALFQAQAGGRGGQGANPIGAAGNQGRGNAQQTTTPQRAGAAGTAGGAGGRGGRGGGDDPTYEIYDALTNATMLVAGGTYPDTVWALNAQGTPVVDRIRMVSADQGATFQVPVQGQQGQQANPLAALQQIFGAPQGGFGANQVQAPRIASDAASNQLIIMANDSDWVKIQAILQSIDLRPLQVLIEVTIAEVSRTNDLTYGTAGRLAHKAGDVADTLTGGSGAVTARDLVLRLIGSSGAIDYSVALNALQSRGDVKVLSMPVILAQNNVQAILNVGNSIPIPSSSTTSTTGGVPSTTTIYALQDVGTTLTITPTINVDGYVNMSVNQTNNSGVLDPTSGQFLISSREATTQVFIKDGATTVIGGLAGKSTNKATSGIPILSSIPILGPLLFGGRIETSETSELFLFLTPHIIDSDSALAAMKEATQRNSEFLNNVPVGQRFRLPPDSAAGTAGTAAGSAAGTTTTQGGRGGGGGDIQKADRRNR